MATPDERLTELGITLPEVPEPLGSYVTCVQTGNLLFISGMLPLVEGKVAHKGKVGVDLGVDEAIEASRTAAINALSVLKSRLKDTGGLKCIMRCIKVTGYIASSPDFTGQPQVLNGASDLIFEVFGEAGRHARAAVGVPVLPMNSPVEVEFIFEVAT